MSQKMEKNLRKYFEKYEKWVLIVEKIEKIFEKFKEN